MSDLKDTKQKYMELETQNHICTNQIRRMDEENKLLKAKYEEGLEREKKLDGHIKEHIRKIDDMQSQVCPIESLDLRGLKIDWEIPTTTDTLLFGFLKNKTRYELVD